MRRRTLWIALFVSLAVNLFVIGAVAGALAFGRGLRPAEPPMRRGPAFWAAADSLSPQQRDAYRQTLRSQSQDVRGRMREARAARREAWRTLGAQPMDAAATIRELDRARAMDAAGRAAVERRIVEFAATLPPADRARFAEALARQPRGGGPGGGRMDRGGPPRD